MANLTNNVVTVEPFHGNEEESFAEFESLLTSSIALVNVQQNARCHFLKLNLKGGALQFYEQLPDAIRNDFEQAKTQLRNTYTTANRRELHKIEFLNRTFNYQNHKESATDFLTSLHKLAKLAYLDPPPADHDAENERSPQCCPCGRSCPRSN